MQEDKMVFSVNFSNPKILTIFGTIRPKKDTKPKVVNAPHDAIATMIYEITFNLIIFMPCILASAGFKLYT